MYDQDKQIKTGLNHWFIGNIISLRKYPKISQGILRHHAPQLTPIIKCIHLAEQNYQTNKKYMKNQSLCSQNVLAFINQYNTNINVNNNIKKDSQLLKKRSTKRFDYAKTITSAFALGSIYTQQKFIQDYYVITSKQTKTDQGLILGQILFQKEVAFIGLITQQGSLIQGQITNNNLKFKGRFKQGKPHGLGQQKFTFQNRQTIFKGNFEQGNKTCGTLQLLDKKELTAFYSGSFKNGLPEGYGKCIQNNTFYLGYFQKGKFLRGYIGYIEGQAYIGEVKNNKREGIGGLFSNGIWSIGIFKQGLLKQNCKFLKRL